MASLRLRLINLLSRGILRRVAARVSGPDRARIELERATSIFLRPPSQTTIRKDGALSWISCGRVEASPVILYFHGGGYIAGSPETHRAMLGRLSKLTGIQVVAPAYRLAPEHPAPAGFEDACAAFSELRARGYAPSQIVLGGDSAGGGLALALLAHLCATDARPAALFAFSPWTDLTMSGASVTSNAAADRLLPAERIGELLDYVAPPEIRADARVSPLFARFERPPPVLMQVAENEILFDDTRRMAEHLRRSGGQVEVQTQPDAPHVWQLLDGYVPEARESLGNVAAFIGSLIPRSRSEDGS